MFHDTQERYAPRAKLLCDVTLCLRKSFGHLVTKYLLSTLVISLEAELILTFPALAYKTRLGELANCVPDLLPDNERD